DGPHLRRPVRRPAMKAGRTRGVVAVVAVGLGMCMLAMTGCGRGRAGRAAGERSAGSEHALTVKDAVPLGAAPGSGGELAVRSTCRVGSASGGAFSVLGPGGAVVGVGHLVARQVLADPNLEWECVYGG